MPQINYAVRLRTSAESLRTTLGDYSCLANQVLCYEHPEPDNIHCHLLLTDVRDTVETLKNKFRAHGLLLKGAGQVSFKTSYKSDGIRVEITSETIPKYITYMSKGKYDPSYNKGYGQEFVDSCKSAWVNHTQLAVWPLYDYFEKIITAQQTNNHVIYDAELVKEAAIAFCFERHHRWSRKMRADVCDLIDTYCYSHKVDKKYKLPFY